MRHLAYLLIILLLPFRVVLGQSEITLEECYRLARENYPNLGQLDILSEITALKHENIKTNHLPKINLKGQASYQSDVPGISMNIPNLEIPEVPKAQYKAYLEFQQNIWDGGLTASKQVLETAALHSRLNQLEVELFQLKDKVNKAWFSAMLAQKSIKVYEARLAVIREKQKKLESGVRNGVIEESGLDVLLAEEQLTGQSITEIEAGYKASLNVLSILTGKAISPSSKLVFNEQGIDLTQGLNRPELALFESQANQLDAGSELIQKQRNPKLFGFGQAGFGQPGLNLLNDKFDSFYLVGVGMSWNVFDWKQAKREKQIMGLQRDAVQAQIKTFKQSISILLEQQQANIEKLNKLLQSDAKIVSLREKISGKSASKLENGTITPADYISVLNSELIAKLRLETHKIQLQEAKIIYNNIKGI